ncbi:MAG: hypothetical protein K8H74_17060 [Notoacmeibacter sp.]|nr:hypothetical protein [Notoacmeibacter sp.]
MIDETDITASNTYVEKELASRLLRLGDTVDADILTAILPIFQPLDDLLRDAVEAIPDKRKSVFVVLETSGGSIETAERIGDLLHYHYPAGVNFIIPNFAMSAGTVLVMCGDRILMDYYSVLGPIDPQVQSGGGRGRWIPALGYLDKFEELVAKSNDGTLSAAELAFMIEKFDPAELDYFEKARDLSIDLLKKWLVAYKFKNWTVTRTNGKTVTAKMKTDRAAQIARKLNETKRWKTHSRGISKDVLVNDVNLIVDDFGADQNLNDAIRSYYRLLQDYMIKRGVEVAIHTRSDLRLM